MTDVLGKILRLGGTLGTRTQNSSDAYQPLATVAEPETQELQTTDGADSASMGSADYYQKPEGRRGDIPARTIAFASVVTILIVTWFATLTSGTSFRWFSWHPLLQSLSITLFSYGILTLQPTSQAKSKAAGLTRHQLAMIVLGFPSAFLGYSAIYATKVSHDRPHFTTWHGIFGLLSFIAMLVQIILGGGSVWFNGALFGGNPGAKLLWKYHRAVGYVAFTLMLITLHLGGAWSSWANEHIAFIARVLAYSFAPVALALAICFRVRTSKMQFF
ncbi:hypothetical protein BDW22DRAFT_1430657 [Trametopsis cervina]|nr:hypothetical protein BDW22DRAFT_1430657 [Trametopsis cervina]